MKRENIKWVEVFDCGTWLKRIFIKKTPDGRCLCVLGRDTDNYINDCSYKVYSWNADMWREISEPEYIPYESWEEFKDRLADGWVFFSGDEGPERIISLNFSTLFIAAGDDIITVTFKEFLKDYTWLDGTPCGKLKED